MPAPYHHSDAVVKKGLPTELQSRIEACVQRLVAGDVGGAESDFDHLIERVQGLVDRKLRMEGAKTDTRDLLGEILFTRMRRGMQQLARAEDDRSAARAAEWVMGAMFSVSALSEFADAFDRALLRSSSAASDFNFAGRTDFISVEEVMQMLAAGKHLGCLSLEKDDNRLDVYIGDGRVYCLDPHRVRRRVLSSGDALAHRELAEADVNDAEGRRAKDGVPCWVTLVERGVLQEAELPDVLRTFGKEALFEFMREREPYAFYYKKLDALPAFATAHDLRLGVTSLLLEGSKQLDDWQQMLTIFPDPEAPLTAADDMFARMGDLALGVTEIKLLTQLGAETTPRSLVGTLGLPLFEVYQVLIRLSMHGILQTSGDLAALQGLDVERREGSVEEAMQEAFAALDENDNEGQRQSAIDRVFGDGGADEGALGALNRVLGDESDEQPSDVFGLLRRPKP